MMNPKKIYPVIFLLFGLALIARINAQENTSLIDFTYRFEYQKLNQSDTLPLLYCVVNVNNLLKFDQVWLTYNDKTVQYYTRNLLLNNSAEYSLIGDNIYFKIKDHLTVPFVIVEGVDLYGKKYDIKECNARGQVINPRDGMVKWENSFERIDSLDYLRKFNGVYKGKDRKPRYRDHYGKVYVIERNYVRAE